MSEGSLEPLMAIRSVMDAVDQGVVILDEPSSTAFVNRSAGLLLGLPSQRVPVADFLAALRRIWSAVLDRDQVVVDIERVTASPDEVVSNLLWRRLEWPSHLLVSSAPLGSGSTRRRVWVFNDVSNEMVALAEAELAREVSRATSNGMLDPQVLVEAIRNPEGMLVDFRYLELNDATHVETGMLRQEMMSRTMAETIPSLLKPGLLELYAETIETGRPLVLDDVAVHHASKGGDRRYAVRATKVADGLSLTWRDVTEQFSRIQRVRDLQRRLDRLLTEGSVVGFRLARGGIIEWVSDSAARVLGYTPGELHGEDARSYCHPDDVEAFFDGVKLARSTRLPTDVSVRVRRADGSIRSLEGRLFLADDESESVEAVVYDITDRVEAERMRAIVTSVASHELRTPLAFIYATLTMLHDGTVDLSSAVGKDLVSRLLDSTERLTRLSDSLLQLQRLELTPMLQADEPILVAAHVRDAAQTVMLERGVRLELDDRSDGVEAEVDADLLAQAVINLVHNAVKYSPDGGVVTVSTVNEPTRLVVTVRDRGRGVPESGRGLIFNAFSQVDRDDRHKGAGLGLAIVQRIAELHGGSVRVLDPSDGVGSLFELTLDRGGRRLSPQ